MGKKDALTKEYMSDNRKFADVFNYYLYGGEQVIRPENLRSSDITELSVPYGTDKAIVPTQKYRDLLKEMTIKADDNAVYLLLGIENQSNIHYAMPVRNMVYDALQYAGQVTKAAQSHKAAMKLKNKSEKQAISEDEYLSGFHKNDRLIPVITLVIYFGPDEWDGPTHLHEMFEADKGSLLKYVPDYQINLIAPANMKKEEIDRLKTDLREVLLFIKYSKDKKELADLLRTEPNFRKMDYKTVQVLNVLTNLKMKIEEREGEEDMCIAVDEMCADARAEGYDLGKTEGAVMRLIELICKKLHKGKTLEVIADELEETSDSIRSIWETAEKYAPDYDVEAITKEVLNN